VGDHSIRTLIYPFNSENELSSSQSEAALELAILIPLSSKSSCLSVFILSVLTLLLQPLDLSPLHPELHRLFPPHFFLAGLVHLAYKILNFVGLFILDLV
jgi:hypothetical protein